MRLIVLFAISLQLVVFLAAFPLQKSVVFLPVLQAGVSVRVCWCGFLLFGSLLVFLLVLSFSLSVSRFSPQEVLLDGCISCVVGLRFLVGGCISCVVGLRFSPQVFLQFRFASFLPVLCCYSRRFFPLGFLLFCRCCQSERFPTFFGSGTM